MWESQANIRSGSLSPPAAPNVKQGLANYAQLIK